MKRSIHVVCLLMAVLLQPFAPTVAAGDETFDDLSAGFTDTGIPYLGKLDAPLTLIEFSDFLCPFCARHFQTTYPQLLEEFVRSGLMRFEFHHFPIPALHATAHQGHQAAACAGDQGAAAFWRFHEALFSRQQEWNQLDNPDVFLASVASALELDENAYTACRKDGNKSAWIEQSMQEGRDLGFSGTPTFQIGLTDHPDVLYTIVGAQDVRVFREHADALLAGKEPPQEREASKPELPTWARPVSLAVDERHPGFTVSGDPSRGDADASTVIVEFTDYQCPACARHLANTQPSIDRELIDTGKVRWVYKTLPLREHANAVAAATAAECAGAQDRFDDVHNALFEQQDSWAGLASPDAQLVRIAAALDLDEQRFATCLGSRQPMEAVLRDIYDAADVTRSTPAFVILDNETGKSIYGTQEPEQFLAAVQDFIDVSLARTDDDKGQSAQ